MGVEYIAVAVVLAAIGSWIIFLYNRLVRDKHNVEAGWSDIGVQLQRRHDLVPKLVDAVKAYADYEQATLTAVTELRRQSEATSDPDQIARIESQLRTGLDRLLAVAEDYPDLKANRSFLELQKELTNTEDKLQYSRRYYNGAVRIYNTRIQSFPDNYLANSLRLSEATYFQPDEQATTDSKVSFE